MEQMVFSEIEKQKESLGKTLKSEYNLNDNEVSEILNYFSSAVLSMVKLMKEGKSAHEKFFSDIILNSIDAIIGFDNDFKIFLWNKGAENLFGYSKQEMMGADFDVLIPDFLLERGEKEFLVNEVKTKGFFSNYETERRTKSGNMISVNVTRFAVYGQENEMIGSVGILRDITTVKKLQKELREKENLALIGEVVSSIAHSLSNPLNIISGNADYLLLNKKEGDVQYEELKTILEETERITKSIRQLLNFSRPIKTNKEPYNINEVIENVISNCKYLKGDKKISFKKNLQKDLRQINLDKLQIEEVLSNIVANSIQAIAREGEIRVKTFSNEEYVNVEISDNGGGIPKENIEKIFQPFFSSKEYGKGTGLGLFGTSEEICIIPITHI
ncbi:MAG: PAS domain S-box protein [Chlorobi bacterium]|nr:PAS domain S-box protein [Chlorobiota bacterium]MCI0717231.1 PAS domain S-box protein [Chlorobiota bacterium]